MFDLRVDPDEKQLRQFYGMPVCLLMKDGSRKIGRLTACRAGRVILNGTDTDDADTPAPRKKQPRRSSRSRIRKPKHSIIEGMPQIQDEGDGLQLGPLGLGPMYAESTPENVPLQSVDSVLIL